MATYQLLNFLNLEKKFVRDSKLKDLQLEDLYYVCVTCFLTLHHTERQPWFGQRCQEHSCYSITRTFS